MKLSTGWKWGIGLGVGGGAVAAIALWPRAAHASAAQAVLSGSNGALCRAPNTLVNGVCTPPSASYLSMAVPASSHAVQVRPIHDPATPGEISLLQQQLIDLGYLNSAAPISGEADAPTLAAFHRFYGDHAVARPGYPAGTTPGGPSDASVAVDMVDYVTATTFPYGAPAMRAVASLSAADLDAILAAAGFASCSAYSNAPDSGLHQASDADLAVQGVMAQQGIAPTEFDGLVTALRVHCETEPSIPIHPMPGAMPPSVTLTSIPDGATRSVDSLSITDLENLVHAAGYIDCTDYYGTHGTDPATSDASVRAVLGQFGLAPSQLALTVGQLLVHCNASTMGVGGQGPALPRRSKDPFGSGRRRAQAPAMAPVPPPTRPVNAQAPEIIRGG